MDELATKILIVVLANVAAVGLVIVGVTGKGWPKDRGPGN